ncbi:MAG: cupin domain-containing protein [Bacteroidales bacterium]|nr:cupin domain-containing protein [Bacteroidales bacterium]
MNAEDFIDKLALQPHPEGGYYSQVYGNDDNGKKKISTIYYMLCNEEFSAFHALHNVVEIWYYHAGEPLNIYVISPDGVLTTHCLSADDEMQVVIEPEHWFAAELSSKKGFALVGCAVAPAFSFDNFELGQKEELLQKFPQHKTLINRLCK